MMKRTHKPMRRLRNEIKWGDLPSREAGRIEKLRKANIAKVYLREMGRNESRGLVIKNMNGFCSRHFLWLLSSKELNYS